MLFLAVFLTILVSEVRPQFPPFSRSSDSISGNLRTSLHLNRPVFCQMEQVTSSWGLRELQDVVEAMSARNRMSPYLLLSQLLERLRSNHILEENLLNSLEGAALQQILEPSESFPPLPPPSMQHAPPRSAAYFHPPEIASIKSEEEDESPMLFVPISKGPRQQSFPVKLDNSHRYEIIGGLPSLQPGGSSAKIPPPDIDISSFRPPMGVTVHVDSGEFGGSIPDVKVTISPYMSIVEALRQADLQFHKVLGLSPDIDVITFARSSLYDCHVVSRVDGVKKNEEYVWKINITDKERQDLYNDVCLPDEKKRLLKPGSKISLFYVRL